MRRILTAAVLFVAAVAPALAQQAPQQPDQLEAALGQQWQAAEVQRQNAAAAIDKILDDRRKLKAEVEALTAKLKALESPVAAEGVGNGPEPMAARTKEVTKKP